MFNFVTVEFPTTTAAPQRVYSFELSQGRYRHEIATIQFRDWSVPYDVVASGSPIVITLNTRGNARAFYGYVHHVNVNRTPGTYLTEVVAVSASMTMKNQAQTIYTGLSADAIVQKIAKKHRFACFAVPHPRIYPQVAQAGHSDWEMMVRLAKQSGYSLRTQNTEIYFQPVMYEYNALRASAPYFVMRNPDNPSGSTMYSFEPEIGEALDHDGDMKAAVAVSGVDKSSQAGISITQQSRVKNTNYRFVPEFFDRFDTHVVTPDVSIAKYEAEAAENRNAFPYRATAKVIGDASLRPDMPVYLDGLGGYYTGYWTILGAEHQVVEAERNSQIYTTTLYVGSNSLGSAAEGSDGYTVVKPNPVRTRAIAPGVRQTVVTPVTTLLVTSPSFGPQAMGDFGVATNRSKQSTNSPVWVTGSPTLNPIAENTPASSQQTKRLVKVQRIL